MAKNYKIRSGGGGRFKGLNASDLGLSAQAKASKVQTDALKLRAAQQKEYSREHETGLRQTGAKEIENAKYLQNLENNIYNTKLNNIKKRAETEVDSIRGKAREARRESDFWMQLAPKYASQLAETGIKLGKWADRRAAQKAFRANTKVDAYFDPNVVPENANKILWKDGFKDRLTEISNGDFSNAPIFADVELSKSENLASLAVEKYNQTPELFDQSFRAELKPGDLTHETAVELRVEYMYKYLADSGVHPNTRGAQKLIDKAISLGRKESQKLYDTGEAGKNMDRLENLFNVYKGSAGTDLEGENLNNLIYAIGTLKRLDGDGNVIYPDKGDTYADWGSKTVDYFIKNMKAGEYSSLQDLLDTRFSNRVFPTSTDSKGRDFDDPNADLSVRGGEFWNTKHSKRFLREHTEAFYSKHTELTSQSKKNDELKTNKAITYIDAITTDEKHPEYLDISDYTPGGDREKLGKIGDSYPFGSDQHTHVFKTLSINPKSHNSIELVTKLQNFSINDHAAFAHIWKGLSAQERKNLNPLFERVQYMQQGRGTLREITRRTEQLYRDLSGIKNNQTTLDGSAKNAIPHTVNKVIELSLAKYDPNKKATDIVDEAFKEATADLILGKGIYQTLDPVDAEPGSGAKIHTYIHFSDIHKPKNGEGWATSKLTDYLKEEQITSYEALLDRADIGVIVGDKSIVETAKDVDDGGDLTYPENVRVIAKKYGRLSWPVMNDVFKSKKFSHRVKPDLEAFLNAKGIEPGTIAPQNYFARNTYTDIVSNIDLANNPFWEKIPMRYEMKTYFESGNNLEATLERIAVEKNQTPYERIKTKRHFSGLIQWQ